MTKYPYVLAFLVAASVGAGAHEASAASAASAAARGAASTRSFSSPAANVGTLTTSAPGNTTGGALPIRPECLQPNARVWTGHRYVWEQRPECHNAG
jgi:hypothetical protein